VAGGEPGGMAARSHNGRACSGHGSGCSCWGCWTTFFTCRRAPVRPVVAGSRHPEVHLRLSENNRNYKNPRRTGFCGFCGFCGNFQEFPMKGTRLAVTESGMAARTAPPTPYRLSRYPAKTAPAAPGCLHIPFRQSTAATSPPRPPARPHLPNHALSRTAGELRPGTCLNCVRGQAWSTTRRSACETPDHGRCPDHR
jgi:hypothetical protein